MLRTLLSFRGLILVLGFVAVGLPIALVGQLGIVRTLNAINDDVAQIRGGQLAAAMVLQYQLDEETAIRGYAATGRRIFLEPYARAREAMPGELATLAQDAGGHGAIPEDERTIGALRALNEEWLRTVAVPIVGGARGQDARLLHGKLLIDRFRSEIAPLNARFAQRYQAAIARRDATIRTTTNVSVLAMAVIALEIVVFGITIARMRYELDRERGFVETLQSAASVRMVVPPHLALARRTAPRHAARASAATCTTSTGSIPTAR